ncbi:MAG: P1 family peptidase, partial [Methyloligellaceae bacterium]
LREKSVGFEIGDINVPIVPQAILFDLLNGGDKEWGTFPPYRDMAYAACSDVSDTFELGSTGAGSGATTFGLKGGLGSASLKLEDGLIVGALAAVNAVGSVVIGQTHQFWAAPFEIDAEFGGHGLPEPFPKNPIPTLNLSEPGENTTLCVVATNAALDQKELTRLAIMAQTGMARAIMPVHTPLDGDIVFALSTGDVPLPNPLTDLTRIGTHTANTLARAIARAIYCAKPDVNKSDLKPAYSEMF